LFCSAAPDKRQSDLNTYFAGVVKRRPEFGDRANRKHLDTFLFEQEKIDIAQEENERRKAEEKTRIEEEGRERRRREEEEKARRDEEAQMTREAEEKVVALLYFGSVLYKHGDVVKRPVLLRLSKDGKDLVYSTCLSAEMVSAMNSKTIALGEVISVEDKQMEAPGTFGIRTMERLHKFDAKTESEKRLWAKAILDAMSMIHFKEEGLPQLQQGVLTTSSAWSCGSREVQLCLSEDATALEYSQTGSPESKKYIRMASVLSVEPAGDDPKGLIIKASDRSHTFDMENSGIKDQWIVLLRAAISGVATQQLWKRVQTDPTLRDKLRERTKKDAAEASAKAGSPLKDASGTFSTGFGSLSKGFGNLRSSRERKA
jgi:hypothetical protein